MVLPLTSYQYWVDSAGATQPSATGWRLRVALFRLNVTLMTSGSGENVGSCAFLVFRSIRYRLRCSRPRREKIDENEAILFFIFNTLPIETNPFRTHSGRQR